VPVCWWPSKGSRDRRGLKTENHGCDMRITSQEQQRG
jgi:hypothetical protein